jgi:hypothetical protein
MDNLHDIYYYNRNITPESGAPFYDVNGYTVLTQEEIDDNTGGGGKPQQKFAPCPDLPTPENSPNPAPEDGWDWRKQGVQTPVTKQVSHNFKKTFEYSGRHVLTNFNV